MSLMRALCECAHTYDEHDAGGPCGRSGCLCPRWRETNTSDLVSSRYSHGRAILLYAQRIPDSYGQFRVTLVIDGRRRYQGFFNTKEEDQG